MAESLGDDHPVECPICHQYFRAVDINAHLDAGCVDQSLAAAPAEAGGRPASHMFFFPDSSGGGAGAAGAGGAAAAAPEDAAPGAPPPYRAHTDSERPAHFVRQTSTNKMKTTLSRAASSGLAAWLGAQVEPQPAPDIDNDPAAKFGNKWLQKTFERPLGQTMIDPYWQQASFFERNTAANNAGPAEEYFYEDGTRVEDGWSPTDEFLIYDYNDLQAGASAESMMAGQEAMADLRMAGVDGAAGRRKVYKRKKVQQAFAPKKHKPYFIWLMTFVNVFALFYMIAVLNRGEFAPFLENPFFGPPASVLLDSGAKYGPYMVPPRNEYYRFVMPIFLHVGLIHLVMNLSFQVKVGAQLEELYGAWRIGIIYMLAGIGGNMISVLFVPNQIQVGASGALYGLLGVLLSDLIQNWSNLKKPGANLVSLLITLVISLGIGLLPVVDNFAHVGGFITGILAAVVFLPTVTFGFFQTSYKIILVLICLPLLIIWFAVGFYLFYFQINPDGWCEFCRLVNCVNFPGTNWCDQPAPEE